MKKNILTVSALLAFAGMQAQIQINNGTSSSITNSNVLIDGSTAFSTEAGAGPNTGKGIVIPAVDLVNFEFDLTLADGVTFPTYFDGMIVYNKATGNTLTTGNRPSTAVAVTPGYYYFSNPNGASNGNITAGQWKPMGGTALGDNLGNHSATQNLILNGNAIRLKDAADAKNQLVYNATVDGPRLFGNAGGYLGTTNGTNSLNWDSNGNININNSILAGGDITAGSGKFFNVQGTGTGIYWGLHGGGWKMVDNNTMYVINDKDIYTGGRIQTGDAIQAGTNIQAGGDITAGTNRWFNVQGTGTGIYWGLHGGGWKMIDNNTMYVINDKNIYTGGRMQTGDAIQAGTNIQAGGDITAGTNRWFNVQGTGTGIYWGLHGGGWKMIDNNTMYVVNDKDIYTGGRMQTGDAIQAGTNIQAGGDITAGTNRWFNVQGTGTGIYWGLHGGGWKMIDNNTMYVVNDKDIYTGGKVQTGAAIQAGTNIIAGGDITAGVNKWFNVQGANSGIYWGQYTGGWYMSDNTWMRVFNDKSIYTGGNLQIGGTAFFGGTVTTPRVQGPSDRRFKKDITPIYGATEKLNQLNGYTYTWRDKKEFPGQALGEGKDMGVIAQEVEKVFPDAVMTNKDGYKSVNYNALIPVLIEALKESNRKIKALEDRVNGSSAENIQIQKRAEGIPVMASPFNKN